MTSGRRKKPERGKATSATSRRKSIPPARRLHTAIEPNAAKQPDKIDKTLTTNPAKGFRMSDDAVVALRQIAPKRPKTGAERARAYRDRKRQALAAPARPPEPAASAPEHAVTRAAGRHASASHATVGARHAATVRLASAALTAAGLALGAASVAINGWFARSLGASDVAGWLFMAVGVAADLTALALPSCAAALWHAGRRAAALAGWAVWFVVFAFAVTAGLGFAAANISDVTLARSSRITPAVVTAQTALADAMTARDRECRGGVGKFCRDREATVAERRQILDSAMAAVGQGADPQTSAAARLIAWLSRGALQPASEDFAMLRLALLALLPQIGGLLLMLGRTGSRI